MRFALAFALALGGCVHAEQPAPEPAAGSCNAEVLAGMIGQPATQALGAEAQRNARAARIRWIRPGDAVTMDYNPSRLNIYLDASGNVDRFTCG